MKEMVRMTEKIYADTAFINGKVITVSKDECNRGGGLHKRK